MSLKTQLHTPICRVKIFKSNYEQEFQDPIEIVGQHSPEDSLLSCITNKDINTLVGTFALTLKTRPVEYAGKKRMWTDIIKPLDFVVISMYRPPQKEYVLMVGTVSTVTEGFRMNDEGFPQRDIVVRGHDLGKQLEQINVRYFPGIVGKDALYTEATRWKMHYENLPYPATIANILNRVMEGYFFRRMDIEVNFGSSVKTMKELFNYRFMESSLTTIKDYSILSEDGNVSQFIKKLAERPFVEAYTDTKADIFNTIRPDKVDPKHGVNGSATNFTSVVLTIPQGSLRNGKQRTRIKFSEYSYIKRNPKREFNGSFKTECFQAIIKSPVSIGFIDPRSLSKTGVTMEIQDPTYKGEEITLLIFGDRDNEDISIKKTGLSSILKDSNFFLFVRPTPFICRAGVMENNPNGDNLWNEVRSHTITVFNMATYELSKHDQEVYNWFMAFPGIAFFDPNDVAGKAFARPQVIGHSIKKYGTRVFEARTIFNSLYDGERSIRLMEQQTKRIRDYFGENIEFRSGQITIEKDDQSEFHIGEKLYILDEDETRIGWTYYIEGVQHQFINYQKYLTSLVVTRGQDTAKAKTENPERYTPKWYAQQPNDFFEKDDGKKPKKVNGRDLTKVAKGNVKKGIDRKDITPNSLHGYSLMKDYKPGELVKFNNQVWEAVRAVPKRAGASTVNMRLDTSDWVAIGDIKLSQEDYKTYYIVWKNNV